MFYFEMNDNWDKSPASHIPLTSNLQSMDQQLLHHLGFVRNADFQAPAQTCQLRIYVLRRPPRDYMNIKA